MKFFKSAVVTAVALCAALAVQARTLDEIKKDGKIIVATEGQFAPFNFFEGTKLTGFEVEVAELVVKKMGLKLEWKTLGFDALLTGLIDGRLGFASRLIPEQERDYGGEYDHLARVAEWSSAENGGEGDDA